MHREKKGHHALKNWVYLSWCTFLGTGCGPEVSFQSNALEKKIPKVVVDQEFKSALISNDTMVVQPAFGKVEQTLTLKEKPPLTLNLVQGERPNIIQALEQGHDGDLISQDFDISLAGPMDLLLVIDNSGSMGEEQEQLGENLRALTKHMSNVDWQVGILTTDSCSLKNMARPGQPIKKGELNAEINFANTVQSLGTSGSRDEQGLKMAIQHLRNTCPEGSDVNTWLRKDAALAVFFVSDEENECDPGCVSGGVSYGPEVLVSQMQSMRSADKLRAYGLLWNRDVTGVGSHNAFCRRDGGVETYGTRYAQVISAFRGIERSICLDNNPATNDYLNLLEQVSRDISRIVKHEFDLQGEPISGSATVTIDGRTAQVADLEIQGRKLKLKNAGEDQVRLKVTYRSGAKTRFDSLKTQEKPADGTLKVSINGTPISNNDYEFDDETGEMTFRNMPPDRAKVEVSYRKNVPLQKELSLKEAKLTGRVTSVKVDGLSPQGWVFNKDEEKVTFLDAPRDGAKIEVQYQAPDYRITAYDALSKEDVLNAKSITLSDPLSGSEVPFSLLDGQIVLDPGEVFEGRNLVVEYDFGDQNDAMSIKLGKDPLPGTFKMSQIDGLEDCLQGVELKGRSVTFYCKGETLGRVKLSYDYVVERYDEFEVTHSVPQGSYIQVFIDQQAFFDFKVEGRKIKIPKEYLGIRSKVRVLIVVEDVQSLPGNPQSGDGNPVPKS